MDDIKHQIQALTAKIASLETELNVAKTSRGVWTDPPTAKYANFDKEVTRISQQLSQQNQRLSQQNQLLIIQANKDVQQASQAGTSAFCLYCFVLPRITHFRVLPYWYLFRAQCDLPLSSCCFCVS
jgi:hypothetical protein